MMQPSRDIQRVFLRSLRQQEHKFVSAVTECKINQAAMLLQCVSNVGQQSRANQMPLRVVHLLEVIEVNENQRKLVVIALRPVNLRLQNEAHVPSVIKR